MDVTGDMSRVLANFYLVEFDKWFAQHIPSIGGCYLRWADDMVFTCPDKELVVPTVYAVSERLHSMGLNVNAAKVKIRSRAEFRDAWGFELMDLLHDHKDEERIREGIDRLRNVWDSKFERREMVLKRAITQVAKLPNLRDERLWVYGSYVDLPEHYLKLKSSQISSLLACSGSEAESLREYTALVMAQPFTEPKAHLLHALERNQLNRVRDYKELYEEVKAELSASGHPVLNVACQFSPSYERP